MNEQKSPGDVLILGAGAYGIQCAFMLERAGVRVVGFLDNYKPTSHSVYGKPVFRPDAMGEGVPDRGETTVLIGIRHPDVCLATLGDEISAAGWKNIIPSLGDFVVRYREVVGDIRWQTPPGYYNCPERLRTIDRVRDIWADRKSREIFDGLLAYRQSYDESCLPQADFDEYFPADVPAWKNPVRFVDGGAYIGDTIDELISRGYSVEAVAAFEPDRENFANLVGRRRDHADFPVLSWPCALGAENKEVRFDVDPYRMDAGVVSDEGIGVGIPCVRLDSVLQGFRPTFIKLDIEGGEQQALEGARGLLRESRPGWAVCAYHKADDLWMIPAWFLDNATDFGYRYYLRNHSLSGVFDHCFYAIPW